MALSLLALLKQSAEQVPDRTAVVEPAGASITYRQLDIASSALASQMPQCRGDRVGVLAHKSIDTVVGLWGAMRTGGTYVPLDPTAPAARSAYIASDCQMRVLLASSAMSGVIDAIRHAVPGIDVILLDGVHRLDAGEPPGPGPPVNTKDLAYVLYTSGSTGVPKGVMVSHGAALGFVDWALETVRVQPTDVLSNHAPFHFDLSTFDLFAAAAAGAAVVLLDEETARLPAALADCIERHRISVWYSVPGVLRRLVRGGLLAGRDLSALRCVLFAGEVYPAEELRALQAALPTTIRLLNLYGPTETNVCTFWEVPTAHTWHHDAVPIGIDCASCQGVVVDEALRPVADGSPGELLVRGSTLMSGYWGDPARTAASFVDNFLQPHLGDRFFRTGDLVSVDAAGDYRFHGRRDHMVKIRGYRVEIGEVEAALHRVAGVGEAAVVTADRTHGGVSERELVAFVVLVGAEPATSPDQIRTQLARELPKYMLPAELYTVSALPMTSSGKVDRQALCRSIARQEKES